MLDTGVCVKHYGGMLSIVQSRRARCDRQDVERNRSAQGRSTSLFAGGCRAVSREVISGEPEQISTSYVERQNLSLRMASKRRIAGWGASYAAYNADDKRAGSAPAIPCDSWWKVLLLGPHCLRSRNHAQ